MLVETAERTVEGRGPDPDSPIPNMTVAEAIAVLKLHRPELRGEGKAPGWRARPRSMDEIRGSILRKLSALERSRGGS